MVYINTHGSECPREKDKRYPSDHSHISAVSPRQGCDQRVQLCVASSQLCEADAGIAISLRSKAINLYSLLSCDYAGQS